MPKLLVFQHVPFEILGTLNPLVKDAGFRIRYVNFGRHSDAQPRLRGYDGLIVLGGPMNVDEADDYPHLLTEMEIILQAVEQEMPVLGICLGAQLIAKALGGEVFASHQPEIGWFDVSPTRQGRSDPLMSHLQSREKIFQWHAYTFSLPSGSTHLASSSACENQAFRYGSRVYGFQFHLEVDERLINRWLTVPVHLEELQRLQGVVDPHFVRKQTRAYIQRSKVLSSAVFGEFIRLLKPVRRKAHLPSR